MIPSIEQYFGTLGRLGGLIQATDAHGAAIPVTHAVRWAVERAGATHAAGNKLMFVGNGGSAAIASHMATDYQKNGKMRSLAFNDGATLTCLSNDLGYENVFSAQIEQHGNPGDLLIAISSSGNSPNILKAVSSAQGRGVTVLTLSGFGADNKLRGRGEMNFYVPHSSYGFVEISHLAICHAILDFSMGLTPE